MGGGAEGSGCATCLHSTGSLHCCSAWLSRKSAASQSNVSLSQNADLDTDVAAAHARRLQFGEI